MQIGFLLCSSHKSYLVRDCGILLSFLCGEVVCCSPDLTYVLSLSLSLSFFLSPGLVYACTVGIHALRAPNLLQERLSERDTQVENAAVGTAGLAGAINGYLVSIRRRGGQQECI